MCHGGVIQKIILAQCFLEHDVYYIMQLAGRPIYYTLPANTW